MLKVKLKKISILMFGIIIVLIGIVCIYRFCENSEMIYRDVEIISIKDNKVICRINDKKRSYETVSKVKDNYKNVTGDIHIKNNKVTKLKILISKENERKDNNIKYSDKNNNTIKNNNIRVVLKTSNYKDIKHKSVTLYSKSGIEINYGKNKNEIYKGKVTINSKSKYFDKTNSIKIKCRDNKNGIKISSIKRAVSGLEYYGDIEIIKENNSLIVVNNVNIEQYLYSVVPSEMPEYFGLETLKVQAICARTYAYIHQENNTYKKYNANIDDSISYQVYNNQKYSKVTKEAVDSTKGQILTYKNKPAKVFYYSTSCGYSSKTEDVFGGENIKYLVSKKQTINRKKNTTNNDNKENMTKEKNFNKFILSTDVDCFEKNCEWFRWKIQWNVNKITTSINKNLKSICANTKNKDILTYKKGKYIATQTTNIGKVKSIKVTKRGSGGVVKQVIITGTKHKVKISNQNTIRKILAPINAQIVKNNKSKVKSMDTLPSAYFIIKKNKNTFTISGGGFGHGVGMSQYGVHQLTKLGKNYKEILNYYFKDITIDTIN